jgi:Protein of unknown function (DUF4239)
MGFLITLDESTIVAVALVLFLLACEAGYRIGLKHHAGVNDPTRSHVNALQATVFGLLALLLAFTVSMALSRYETRKELVLAEANAIGTAALRAALLADAQRSEATALLRQYVDARLAFYNAGIDPARLAAAAAETTRLQQALWATAVRTTRDDARSVPAGLFVQALNDVIDLDTKRAQALKDHIPAPVLYLVLATALVALGFLGAGCGLDARRRFGSTALVCLLLALVLAVILDLDRPRRGLIQVSQDSMLGVKASLAKP